MRNRLGTSLQDRVGGMGRARRAASMLGALDRRLVAGIAFGLLAISSATAFDEGTARSAANNMLSLFGERSPGARTAGELVKTKRPITYSAADVLAPLGGGEDVAAAPPAAIGGGEAPPVLAPAAVAGAPLPVLIGGLPEGGAIGGPGGGAVFFPGIGGGGFIGGIGGGGGGGGGVPNPGGTVPQPGGEVVIPPPTVAPIPEPSTWAMVITGFGFIGLALRRKPKSLSGGKRSKTRPHG